MLLLLLFVFFLLGYEIRNFPMCFVYIRDQLNEINYLQPIILSSIWIMYGHLLTEEQTSIMSTDIIHNYLTNVVCEILIIFIKSCFFVF